MNIRRSVDVTPLVVFGGLVAATITATLGIALPLVQAAHDAEIANAQRDAQVAAQSLQNDNSDLRTRINDLLAQITTITAEKAQLEDNLSAAEHDAQEAAGSSQNDKDALQARIDDLNDQVAAVGAQKARLEAGLAEAQLAERSLQDDKDGLQTQVNDLLAQITAITAQKSQLEGNLSGVQRVLGGDSQQLDVSRLVVTQDKARDLPAQSTFFSADRFYALDAAKAADWAFAPTTELRMLADQGGLTEDQERQTVAESGYDPNVLTRWPVYLWRRPGVAKVEGIPSVSDLYTQVFVQRAPIDDMLGTDPKGGPNPRRADGMLALLANELASELSMGGQFLSGLQTIQQRDGVIYARFESVLSHVTVDGEALPEYYWTRELLIVATPDSFYLVKTFLPNRDHRSPDFARLTEWFEDFAVLVDG